MTVECPKQLLDCMQHPK